MKNKKVLALALSAGLVFAGAANVYAADYPNEPDLTADLLFETGEFKDPDTLDETTTVDEDESITDFTDITEKEATPAELFNSGDSVADLTWDESWTIPEENLEKTLNESEEPLKPSETTYEALPEKRGEAPTDDEIRAAAESFLKSENRKEIVDAMIANNTINPEGNNIVKAVNNLGNSIGRDNLLEDFRDGKLSPEEEKTLTDAILSLAINNKEEIFAGKSIIDYLKTEYVVNNEERVITDNSKPAGYREVLLEAEEGFNRSIVTEKSYSTLWKIGQYYTSDEIINLINKQEELGLDTQEARALFNKVDEKVLADLSDEELSEFFINGKRAVYDWLDAKDANGVPNKDKVDLSEVMFKKPAVRKTVLVGKANEGEWAEAIAPALPDEATANDYFGEEWVDELFPKDITNQDNSVEIAFHPVDGRDLTKEENEQYKVLLSSKDKNDLKPEEVKWYTLAEKLIPATPIKKIPGGSETIPGGGGYVPTPWVVPTPSVTPVTPIPTPAPTADPVADPDVDKLIKDLNDGTKEITDVLTENEKNQEETPAPAPTPEPTPAPKADDDDNTAPAKPVEKEVVKEVVKVAPAATHSNPQTGIAGMSSVAGLLAVSMAGIVATRKRNN